MEVTTTGVEDVINTYLRRTNDGLLRVHVKVHPDVELFFRKISHDVTEAVRVYGKFWAPVPALDGSAKALRVWAFDWPQQKDDYLNPGTLHAVGNNPRLDNGRVNLSFLRLVGAGTPEGVSFTWNAMLGDDELRRLSTQLHRAQERFYTEFVKPTEIEIAVERRLTPQ